MALPKFPIPANDPQGLNHLNQNFDYLEQKTNAMQAPPFVVASEPAMLALEAVVGNTVIRTDLLQEFILTALPASSIANWMQLPSTGGSVMSVNGQTGNVVLNASHILNPATGNALDADVADGETALLMANRLYVGSDLSVKFAIEIAAAPFTGNVWAWFQARIQSENFTGINIGDFIPLIIEGNTYAMEVAGINTYKGYGDTAGVGADGIGNHIDLISRELLPDLPFQWNRANYNNGTTVSPNPWLASEIFARLNSLQMSTPSSTAAGGAPTAVDYRTTGVLDKLPAALLAVLVQKRAMLPRRFTAGSLLLDDNSWDWANMGLLWLPSEIEVYGCRQWGSNQSPEQGRSSGGFVQYPIFATNMKRAKRTVDTGVRSAWWLSAARGGYSTYAASVSGTGTAGGSVASNTGIRAPVCFRIS